MVSTEEHILKLKKYLDTDKNNEKLLHVLCKLDKLHVTVDNLQTTGIGKAVNTFRKLDNSVGEKARVLVAKWKQLVSGALSTDHVSKHQDNKEHSRCSDSEKTSKTHKETSKPSKHSKDHTHSNVKSEKYDGKEKGHNTSEHHRRSEKKERANSPETHSVRNDSEAGSSKKSAKHADVKKSQQESSKEKGKQTSTHKSHSSGSKHDHSKHSSKKRDGSSNKKLGENENVEQKKRKTDHENNVLSSSRTSDLAANDDEETSEMDDGNNGVSFEDFLNYDAASAAKLAKKKNKSHNSLSNNVKKPSNNEVSSKSNLFDMFSSKTSESNTSGHKASTSKHHHKNKDGSHTSSSSTKSSRDHGKSSHSHHKSSKHKHSDKHRSQSSDKVKTSREKSRKRPACEFSVPMPPTKQAKLSTSDILQTLPEIQPNYKPLRMPVIESPKKKPGDFGYDHRDMEVLIGSKRHSRTQVYSGKRSTFLTEVPRLYDACMKVLIDNIDALESVGGVPTDILFPVLERCTPSQLFTLEDYNPYFVEDTEPLWKIHCQRDFKTHQPEEFETYRELYLKEHDAREAKLKALTANINASMMKKTPVRQTKLAYVNTVAKPPREVLRRQMRNGTAGPMIITPPKPGAPRPSSSRPPAPSKSNMGASLIRQRPQQKEVKMIAPMMQKTLKFMKNMRR